VTGVPESFVVDRTGRIRYRHAGPLMEDVWHEVFEPLLAQLQVEP
jgi:cytochrome c biogenesis protein CcmG/thiol:disulfide interchange protein DsbE